MLEIACRTLTLSMDDRGRVTHLRRTTDSYDYLSAGSPPVGLWQLGLIRPVTWSDPLPPIRIPDLPYEGHEWWANRDEYDSDLALDSDQAPVAAITGDENGASLVWSMPVPGGAAEVVVDIRGGADAERLEFGVRVSLPPDWAIKSVVCPRIRGWGDPEAAAKDALLFPENWGVLRHNPLEDMTDYTGQYPGGTNWCQMAAWLHGEKGVYVGVLDPATHHTGIDAQYVEGDEPAPTRTQRWFTPSESQPKPAARPTVPLAERLAAGRQPAMQLQIRHWPAMTAQWTCPYPVTLQGFDGGWYGAAQLHRGWATRQRWCRRGRLAKRTDTSPALLGLDVWFMGYGFGPGCHDPKPAWEFQKAMHRLHDFFEMPFGVHWYHWHRFNWHGNFPAHAPVVEGFEEVTRELQSRGLVIMPYCQGRLLYRDRPAIESERAHAVVEANGQPYLEMYTSADDWPLALCPNAPWSQAQWHEAARMLWRDYGTEGVYYDQISAMPPSLCYHAGHGHAPGGGTQYWEGYNKALAALADMQKEDPRRFLASELMADAFIDRLDVFLSIVPPIDDYVPLYTAIYGGYSLAMGRATFGDAMENLQLFAIGQGEQFLFGGMLGWLSESILDHPEAAAFLKSLARLRARVRPILNLGEMAAPLAMDIQAPPVEVDLPPSASGKPRPIRLRREAVRHTAWRGADGRALVLLLNQSRAEAPVTFDLPAGWPAGAWTVWTQGRDKPEARTVSGPVHLTVPPLTALAFVSGHE